MCFSKLKIEMPKNRFLSILFCVSSGLNDEHLGADEQEIVSICNIMIDAKQLKTIDIFNAYLTPQHRAGLITSNESNTTTLESFIAEVKLLFVVIAVSSRPNQTFTQKCWVLDKDFTQTSKNFF